MAATPKKPVEEFPRFAKGIEKQLVRKCTATNRRGERCGNYAIRGGNVCKFHGGGAPQVRRKANLRLAALVEPAIATLAKEMVQADKSADRQRAANSILDRAGFGRTSMVNATDARDILVQRLMEMRNSKQPDGTETTELRIAEQVQRGAKDDSSAASKQQPNKQIGIEND